MRATKHRFGPTGELGLFEMGDTGLAAVTDPCRLLLGDRRPGTPGSAVLPAMQGQRALLVEVQALTARSSTPAPPPAVGPGLDGGRLALLLAVLEQHAGLSLGRTDVFASAVGGIRVTEPAADLALALALASARQRSGAAARPGGLRRGGPGRARSARSPTPRGGWRRRRASGSAGRSCPASCPDGPGGIELVRVRVGGATRSSPPSPAERVATPPGGARAGVTSATHRNGTAHVGPRVPCARGGATELRPWPTPWPWLRPGQPLRDGLDRVLQANRGALIVVGDGPDVLSICSGGFLLDAEFSPQRLSELAKMDGAIILSADAARIARANVHLMPNATIPTSETGTRHRTAERVARSIDVPVMSVSAAMGVITVYRGDASTRAAATSAGCTNGSGQALQTSQRFRSVSTWPSAALSALEIAGHRDGARRGRRAAAGRDAVRIAEEVDGDLVELGEDGRLLRLQLEELLDGVAPVRRLVVRDYLRGRPPGPCRQRPRGGDRRRPRRGRARASNMRLRALARLTTDELLDARRVAAVLGLGAGTSRPRRRPGAAGLSAPAPPAPFPRGHHRPDRGAIRRPAADHAGHRWASSRRSREWARPGPGR